MKLHPEILRRLKNDAAKVVSNYFAPHPDQTVTVNRGDLAALIAAYESKENG